MATLAFNDFIEGMINIFFFFFLNLNFLGAIIYARISSEWITDDLYVHMYFYIDSGWSFKGYSRRQSVDPQV